MGVLDKPRPQVGLLLSIGEQVPVAGKEGVTRPAKLDHFRAKPGQLGQYLDALDKFHEVYGDTAKKVDCVLVSDAVGDSLDIRWKLWGTSGIKALGQTNYATYPPEIFRERLDACDDEVIAFPDDKPEPVHYKLKGPEDALITKRGMKLYGTFRFALHRVTGLTTLAEISTTSRRSMTNLKTAIEQLQLITGGRVVGIPLELVVRPTRGRYWDEKAGKRRSTDFYELVLQTPYSVDEFFELVQARQAIRSADARPALPPVRHDDEARDGDLFDSEERQVHEVLDGVVVPDDGGPVDELDGIDFGGAEVVE